MDVGKNSHMKDATFDILGIVQESEVRHMSQLSTS